ncbi:serine recombinase [Bacillus phage vB_Bacillus_1020A]|jgi:repressor LexA|uniref:LexA family protein n=1 Tax=Robertmurraya sp. DFI.2.37 TaxID=3031819 RepID=UPI001248E49B|nr:S24 family peptidase [Robertmurraya sp. DFI.2.37]MDF1511065.1 S24 family peptidase [Robertmurraya sp. DFI.2.37]QIW89334.1 serine recombinase [Bacillus phage vB_Bacillus_1020A]
MSIGENIKKLRELHNLSQKELGEIAGVSDKAVSTWEKNEKSPRMGAIQKIADHFGILKSDIIENKNIVSTINEPQQTYGSDSVPMPLLGSIAAGVPIEMIPVKEMINVPREIADMYPDAFLVKVSGDSMNKVIPSGALALIDPTEEIKNGDIAAVSVNGYDATLKRFYKFQDGITLEPESYNPNITTQFFSSKEQEYNPIHLKGKLVWYMAPLDIKF